MFSKIKICFILGICLFLTAQLGYSQTDKDYQLEYPLHPPLQLSGNFGEFRANHFHSGLDIKTNGKEGVSVKSIADGYVSRISIRHGGFGKALYIRHPSGLTSVYAHLQNFNDEITGFVKKRQYKNESYTIELFPEYNELIITKGQLIALSGNTGGSYGPHLHFEIRNTATENPVNPHSYGIHVTDIEIPKISKIMLVPYDEQNDVFLTEKSVEISINTKNNISRLIDTISLPNAFGVQFYGHDITSTSVNRLGVYKFKLQKDRVKLFEVTLDKFSFSESRYLNACIDYGIKKERKQTWIRCFRLPNNQFSSYTKNKLNGLVKLDDDDTHRIKLIVEDYYGNSKEISVPVKLDKSFKTHNEFKSNFSKMIYWNTENRFISKGIELNFSANSFYNDVAFQFIELPKSKETYSPIYSIHRNTEPLHKYYNIKINVSNIKNADKLLIASKDKNAYFFEGGKVENGVITARIRSFGNFTVIADSVAPTLEFIKTPKKGESSILVIKLKDELSGIKSYKTLVNKKWLLMEFDPKSNRMIGDIRDLYLSGELTIECVVEDKRQNVSRISKTIDW